MAKQCFGLEITELRLGLPGAGSSNLIEKKRVFSKLSCDRNSSTEDEISTAKSQVVGWPPVCSYRRNSSFSEVMKKYVKVSMDGAPILRKIDLSTHAGYDDLAKALETLFVNALKDRDNSDFVPIYEDKDGDWMLVSDVPWEMFIESCKRLRIMKKSEAKGMDLQAKPYTEGALKNG